MKAADRRAQLLEVAISAFGKRGFSGTTTKAIARAAGVSEATVFRHFPSKEELYVAAFEHRAGGVGVAQFVTILEGYADRGDDEGLLRTLNIALLAAYERDRDLHRMLLHAWLDQERAANARMWERMRRYPLFEFLDRYVARRQAEGVFRACDTSLLSAALMSLALHYGTQTKLYGSDSGMGSPCSDEQIAGTFARLLLNGVRVEPLPGATAPDDAP